MTKIKTITSHTGLSRWLAETSDPIAWITRASCAHIPSPYASGPSKAVMDWNGRQVVYFEVRHKRYEVYEVPSTIQRFATDGEATDQHIRMTTSSAAR